MAIDALDELLVEDQFQATLLTKLQVIQLVVNLIVTLRFVNNIRREFRGILKSEITASPRDVQTFVVDRITHSDRLLQHVSKDTALRKEIIKTVVGNTQKMYNNLICNIDLSTTL